MHLKFNKIHHDFLKSALSFDNPFISVQEVIQWIKEQNQKVKVEIRRIPFNELKLWHFDEKQGNLCHETGRFFSIQGIRVNTNYGKISSWDQPIIDQPEIGYLGFITREFNGILHFLTQAKIEPGNVNYVQLSPTLQATKSNYTRAHKGKSPDYLDFFLEATPDQILVDQLQSEQGARFLKKRNRNIIIKVEEEIPLLDNFVWLTLAQIKVLMGHNNLVNMDTRTVVSGIPLGNIENPTANEANLTAAFENKSTIEGKLLNSTLLNNFQLNGFDNIISFITRKKVSFELDIQRIPLAQVNGWQVSSDSISQIDDKYFRIIAVEVSIGNREVISWTQPMVEPMQNGLCAFVCKEINGTVHFAVQAKLECGNFDIIEFAPTVQCLTGNYRNTPLQALPFLDYVLSAKSENIIFDTLQSEEGGRFYREQNRNMLVLAGDEIPLELPDNFIWMTLGQLQTFIKFNNYINIQAKKSVGSTLF